VLVLTPNNYRLSSYNIYTGTSIYASFSSEVSFYCSGSAGHLFLLFQTFNFFAALLFDLIPSFVHEFFFYNNSPDFMFAVASDRSHSKVQRSTKELKKLSPPNLRNTFRYPRATRIARAAYGWADAPTHHKRELM
jgi:hypothetical protein